MNLRQLSVIRISGVIFDLDGTLADTAADLLTALNVVCDQHNQPLVDLQTIRPWVSDGAAALIKLAFGPTTEIAQQQLRRQLLDAYLQTCCQKSTLFEGMDGVLDYLLGNQIPFAVVTNKPGRFSEPLMRHLGLENQISCLVSGDSLATRKPDPAPIVHACEAMQISSSQCLAIGDSSRDVTAGIAAGCTTMAAAFGYIPPADDPHRWGAHYLVNSASEIRHWLNNLHTQDLTLAEPG